MQHGYITTELISEGRVIGTTSSDDTSGIYNPASGFVIVNLNAGDLTYVRVYDERHCTVVGRDHIVKPTFSGWLLSLSE